MGARRRHSSSRPPSVRAHERASALARPLLLPPLLRAQIRLVRGDARIALLVAWASASGRAWSSSPRGTSSVSRDFRLPLSPLVSRGGSRLWTCFSSSPACERRQRLGRSAPGGRWPSRLRGDRFAMEGAGGANDKKK